jgi:hypothetical protein
MRDTTGSRERCWTEELGNGLGCLSPLARRNTAAIGRSVDKSPSTTAKKHQSKTSTLTATIPAPATTERSQLDRFLFSLTWSLFRWSTRNVSQRFWSAIRIIENGGYLKSNDSGRTGKKLDEWPE